MLFRSVEFDEYNNYSLERFNTSELLINAYNEKIISAPEIKSELSFDIKGNAEKIKNEIIISNKEYPNKEYFLAISYSDIDTVEFNGLSFKLKPKCLIVNNCMIQNVKQINKEVIQLLLKIKDNSAFKIYTNKDLNTIRGLEKIKLLVDC